MIKTPFTNQLIKNPSGFMRHQKIIWTPNDFSVAPTLWLKSRVGNNYRFGELNTVISGIGDGEYELTFESKTTDDIVEGGYVYVTGCDGVITGIYRILDISGTASIVIDSPSVTPSTTGSVYAILQSATNGDLCRLWLDARDTLETQNHRWAYNIAGNAPSVLVESGLHWLQSEIGTPEARSRMYLSSGLTLGSQATVFAMAYIYSAYTTTSGVVILGDDDGSGVSYIGRYSEAATSYYAGGTDLSDYFSVAYGFGVGKLSMRYRRNGASCSYADTLTSEVAMTQTGTVPSSFTVEALFGRGAPFVERTDYLNRFSEIIVVPTYVNDDELTKCNKYLANERGASL